MICQPCREPHDAAACIDEQAERGYPWRQCVCQHRPVQVPTLVPAEGDREPEGE
jgi:hypothetical protein